MSDINAKYFAYQLTLQHPQRDLGVDRLGISLLNATIDMNPHQIDGALFYFDNPLSRGVILADEVGLGKTIEAGIILCQLWSEMKRRILLVVPATLRKQWINELHEKFHLPAKIIDGQVYRQMKQDGVENPFDQDAVIVCSYDMGAKKDTENRPYGSDIDAIQRDVVVFDEAHKLRNVYRDLSSDLDDFLDPDDAYDADGNRKESMAKRLYDRFFDTKKILLTATPLQNSLLELFGMMSFVDPYAFGDLDSFKEQFVGQSVAPEALLELKERIQPFFHRTLRRQVSDQIKYTKRIPHTIEYERSDQESEFYEMVSDFLRTCPLFQSNGGRVNYLVVLVYWKLLASSVPAILGTMRKLHGRLKKEKYEIENNKRVQEIDNADAEVIEDEDILETYKEEAEELSIELTSGITNTIDDATIKDLERYIIEVEKYISLGESITEDNKAKALLNAIDVAYQELDKLGAKRKVLIFTESRRTQDYLYEYLQSNGFENKVICFNGTNNSPETRAIYQDRKKEFEGTRYFSGSTSSDTRAALVEHFRNDAEILIATESASEGINLQFCSLLINYDLPWNPQRVEQRIGRCHRYGQEFDVFVMNLINTENRADERVFELLTTKFSLFDGLFGASDDILGAVESGTDIEKKIFDIYQTCRSKNEIDEAFDELQVAKKEQVETKIHQTKQKIINRLDEDVARRLKDKKEKSELMLNELQIALFQLVSLVLGENVDVFDASVRVHAKNNVFPDGTYGFDTATNDYLLRTNDPLGEYVTNQAKQYVISPQEVTFDIGTHLSRISALEPLQGMSGWMQVQCLTINAYTDEQYLLHSCITDTGDVVDEETASKMFRVLGNQLNSEVTIPKDMSGLIQQRSKELSSWIKDQSRLQNEKHFDTAMDTLDNRAEDLKKSLEKQQKKLKIDIRQLKKDVKASTPTLQEKIALQRKIKNKEKKLSQLRRELHQLEDQIEAKKDTLIDDIESRLDANCKVEELFTIRWHIV